MRVTGVVAPPDSELGVRVVGFRVVGLWVWLPHLIPNWECDCAVLSYRRSLLLLTRDARRPSTSALSTSRDVRWNYESGGAERVCAGTMVGVGGGAERVRAGTMVGGKGGRVTMDAGEGE